MAEDFGSLQKALNEVRSKTRYSPIRVKLNENWVKKNFVPVGASNYTEAKTIFGLPFEFDDTVENYEFVYEEGKH